jgi:hypothetical protein
MFTALYPFTLRGADTLYPGIIACQSNAYYAITGTMFGSDVTAASASNDDASIKLISTNVGTSSPYSMEAVPGVGLFWFTSDRNVYWLPEGSLVGRFIGDKIQANVNSTTKGIENANLSQLGQVWMRFFYPYLMLGIPAGSDAYATTQFWLDIRSLINNPERGPVWYGPMTGQSVGRAWVETQNGDGAIMGGEGNSSNGMFVYTLRATSVFTDAVGASDNNVSMIYRTPYPDFGAPSRGKYVQNVNADLFIPTGTATCQLYDLDGALGSASPFVAL